MTWLSRLLRPVALSTAAVLWTIAALLAAAAVTSLRRAIPLELIAAAHWTIVHIALLVVFASAPFLSFHNCATWIAYRTEPRRWLIAGAVTASVMWFAWWAGVAVSAKVAW